MPEKQEEGLELDELDVDVPTAADVVGDSEGLHDGLEARIDFNAKERPNELEEGDELVRHEDHEEALQQAVEKARERERRRILDIVEGLFENSFKPNLEGEAKELRAGGEPSETADMLDYFAEHFKEELEEEVEQNNADM